MTNENDEYEFEFDSLEKPLENKETQKIFTLNPEKEKKDELGGTANLWVSLENFNPLDTKKRLNSPISLQICKTNGILPSKIFHTTYEEIKEKCNPLKRNNHEYLKLKYIETENYRLKLVEHLKALRRALLQSGQTTKFLTSPLNRLKNGEIYQNYERTESTMLKTYMNKGNNSYKVFNTYGNTQMFRKSKYNASQIIEKNGTFKLDKSVIDYEKHRVETSIAKEIKIIVEKARKNNLAPLKNFRINPSQKHTKSFISSQVSSKLSGSENNGSEQTDKSYVAHNFYPKKSHNISLVSSKEADALQRIQIADEIKAANIKAKMNITKRRKLIKDLREEQHKELKEAAERVNEFKKEQILDRIIKHRDKTVSLERKRTELSKLRQKIRKEADFRKYLVKSELEKSYLRFKVIFRENNGKFIGN